jgi:hypothetical protein
MFASFRFPPHFLRLLFNIATSVLSKEHMITVKHRKKKGGVYEETVKPLDVLWKNFPGVWTPANTIHIDDMSPNFQLNPKNGLAIVPYKDASRLRDDDLELMYLTKYLLLISKEESDFTALNHKQWKEYIISKLWQKQKEYAIPELEIRTPFDRNLLLATGKSSKKGGPNQLLPVAAVGTGSSSSVDVVDASMLPPAPTEPAPLAPGATDLLSFDPSATMEQSNPFVETAHVANFNPFAEDPKVAPEEPHPTQIDAAPAPSPDSMFGNFLIAAAQPSAAISLLDHGAADATNPTEVSTTSQSETPSSIVDDLV